MAQAAVKNGKYLYAIVNTPPEPSYGFVGIDAAPVYCIAKGSVAAVVSDITSDKIRPERRHLATQQAVLKELLKQAHAMLPMAFGIIANGPKAIQKILVHNHEVLAKQLQRVAGMVEMGLKVSWSVPNIFEFFVNIHPELQVARDRFMGPYGNPSQEDKIELGRLFDRLLTEDREDFTEKVEEVISACCGEIKRNKCRNENEVMNLACLVSADQQDEFEKCVFKAAQFFDNNYTFDYNGPWAPHNFVELDLKM
jgi:hypothetical protein